MLLFYIYNFPYLKVDISNPFIGKKHTIISSSDIILSHTTLAKISHWFTSSMHLISTCHSRFIDFKGKLVILNYQILNDRIYFSIGIRLWQSKYVLFVNARIIFHSQKNNAITDIGLDY